MKRLVIYVEAEDSLSLSVLSGLVNTTPSVLRGDVFPVGDDDTVYELGQHLSALRYQRVRALALLQDSHLFDEGKVCMASVQSSYSYRSHRCEKPAKGLIEVTSGPHALAAWEIGPSPAIPACGIHLRFGRWLSRYVPNV